MITIKGKTPTDVKAGVWLKLSGFDPFHDDMFDLDGTLERIALVYELSKEDVADNINVSDILPCYLDCVKLVNSLVLSKLNNISSKNSSKKK